MLISYNIHKNKNNNIYIYIAVELLIIYHEYYNTKYSYIGVCCTFTLL